MIGLACPPSVCGKKKKKIGGIAVALDPKASRGKSTVRKTGYMKRERPIHVHPSDWHERNKNTMRPHTPYRWNV